MSEATLKWIEICFDLAYLITIWIVVFLMYKRRHKLEEKNRRIGFLFLLMFFLLAFGDTGHVGFRVLAYGLGGLEENPLLVGLGALATAITVTFFYMLATEVWRLRFEKSRLLLWWILIITGIIRLIIMIPAGNQWGSVVPPYVWSLARNIPLMIQGLVLASILFIDGRKHRDRFSLKISLTIFLSYLFYTPVILFVSKFPILGMLMIPKTLAYVGLAFISLHLFSDKREK